jgi:hypothetical protein
MEEKIGEIAIIFTNVRDQLKFYHWTTTSYSRHKASDMLVTNLTTNIDLFIETIQGSRGVKLKIPLGMSQMNLTNIDDKEIITLLDTFRKYLSETLPLSLNKNDTELLNIRDTMLTDVNQTLYLFMLK